MYYAHKYAIIINIIIIKLKQVLCMSEKYKKKFVMLTSVTLQHRSIVVCALTALLLGITLG